MIHGSRVMIGALTPNLKCCGLIGSAANKLQHAECSDAGRAQEQRIGRYALAASPPACALLMEQIMTEFIIKKSFHFYAAHRNEDREECHPCYSIHGHTFFLDCYLAFSGQDESGVTKLFSDIEAMILPVVGEFDHSLILNRSDSLYDVLKDRGMKLCVIDCPSSAENLARIIFDRITERTSLKLVRVDFRETTSSVVTYLGTAAADRPLATNDAVSSLLEVA